MLRKWAWKSKIKAYAGPRDHVHHDCQETALTICNHYSKRGLVPALFLPWDGAASRRGAEEHGSSGIKLTAAAESAPPTYP